MTRQINTKSIVKKRVITLCEIFRSQIPGIKNSIKVKRVIIRIPHKLLDKSNSCDSLFRQEKYTHRTKTTEVNK